MRTALITGHKGFIGRHLFAEMQKMYNVIGIDIKDGNDLLVCPLPEVDIVVHLAAKAGVRESLQNPNLYWEQNVKVSERLFNFYKNRNTHILYASSSSAKQWHLNPYATTKKVVEQIAPPRSLGMRFHTVYGFDSRPDMLYDNILNRTVPYATSHTRDFTHVDDVVSGIITLLHNKIVGVVDIGSGNPVSVVELLKHASIDVPIKDTTGEAISTLADPFELRELDWSPTKNIFVELDNDIIRKIEMEKHTQHR